MTVQTLWLERKFDFNFSAGIYPCILKRLRGTPARLEEMTRGLPPKVLAHKPDGKWSIQEHIGHLCDLEELHDARIDDFARGEKLLRAADMKNRKTEEARHNSKSLDTLLLQFRNGRTHFVERLSVANHETVSVHPRLKQPMRLVDMAFFVAEHDDHHIAFIRRLIGMPSK